MFPFGKKGIYFKLILSMGWSVILGLGSYDGVTKSQMQMGSTFKLLGFAFYVVQVFRWGGMVGGGSFGFSFIFP